MSFFLSAHLVIGRLASLEARHLESYLRILEFQHRRLDVNEVVCQGQRELDRSVEVLVVAGRFVRLCPVYYTNDFAVVPDWLGCSLGPWREEKVSVQRVH